MSLPEEIHIRSGRGDYSVAFRHSPAEGFGSFLNERSIFVVDRRLMTLFREEMSSLPEERLILLSAGEDIKSYEGAGRLCAMLLERNVKRDDTVFAVGGGTIQDAVSFASSILFRGLKWVFVPTTLLAIADSCIGGKTSINLGQYKNQVGSFHPPVQVRIFTRFLDTLTVDEIKSGLGEILHYYVYANEPGLSDFLDQYDRLLSDRTFLMQHVSKSLLIKKSVIEKDEFDTGERKKFNYGHTFGHALEAITDFRMPHGQAVTVGMALANFISKQKGLVGDQEYERLYSIFSQNFPDRAGFSLNIDAFLSALSRDKKNVDANLVCILCGGGGNLQVSKIPLDDWLTDTIRNGLMNFGFSVL